MDVEIAVRVLYMLGEAMSVRDFLIKNMITNGKYNRFNMPINILYYLRTYSNSKVYPPWCVF